MGNTAATISRGKLVGGDNRAAAGFAANVLGDRCGFDVTYIADPVVAVGRVADEQWHLVLADLDLLQTGLDLLASVRRMAPGLPVGQPRRERS